MKFNFLSAVTSLFSNRQAIPENATVPSVVVGEPKVVDQAAEPQPELPVHSAKPKQRKNQGRADVRGDEKAFRRDVKKAQTRIRKEERRRKAFQRDDALGAINGWPMN